LPRQCMVHQIGYNVGGRDWRTVWDVPVTDTEDDTHLDSIPFVCHADKGNAWNSDEIVSHARELSRLPALLRIRIPYSKPSLAFYNTYIHTYASVPEL
jgi:hypothetical protein